MFIIHYMIRKPAENYSALGTNILKKNKLIKYIVNYIENENVK